MGILITYNVAGWSFEFRVVFSFTILWRSLIVYPWSPSLLYLYVNDLSHIFRFTTYFVYML